MLQPVLSWAVLLVGTNSELSDGSSTPLSRTTVYYCIRNTLYYLLLMYYHASSGPFERIRPAKPDDWTQFELNFLMIKTITLNKQEFFGSANLPTPVIPSLAGFMTIEDREHAVDGETRKLLHYLDLVLDPQVGQESVVDNFAEKLLEKLGYDDGDRIIFTRRTLPVVVAGEPFITQVDVCVMDDNNQILLILQDNLMPSLMDPEPQIVAKAIAAFEANNKVQVTSLNLPPHRIITFPVISMIGTKFTFYKITITADLCAIVQQGKYSSITETRLLRYIPELPRRHDPGMRPLENRVEILACLEAFKQFVGN